MLIGGPRCESPRRPDVYSEAAGGAAIACCSLAGQPVPRAGEGANDRDRRPVTERHPPPPPRAAAAAGRTVHRRRVVPCRPRWSCPAASATGRFKVPPPPPAGAAE